MRPKVSNLKGFCNAFKLDKLGNYFGILLIGLVVYDFVKLGTNGMIEMFTNPLFYIIIIALVLTLLIFLFTISKISSRVK